MLSGILLPVLSLTTGHFVDAEPLDFIVDTFDVPLISHYPVILLLGIAALFGQVYLTKAFTYPKTGIIGAIGFSNIVFSVIFGTMLGDAFPDVLSLIGIFLIIVCGIMVSYTKTS